MSNIEVSEKAKDRLLGGWLGVRPVDQVTVLYRVSSWRATLGPRR